MPLNAESQEGDRALIRPKQARCRRRIPSYNTEIVTHYGKTEGLSDEKILSMALDGEDRLWVVTSQGLVKQEEDRFQRVEGLQGRAILVAPGKRGILVATDQGIYEVVRDVVSSGIELPKDDFDPQCLRCLVQAESVLVATGQGLYSQQRDGLFAVRALNDLLGENKEARQVACDSQGRIAVAGEAGLYLTGSGGRWERLFPNDEAGRSWAPRDVRAVAFDREDRLWFASPQGAGCLHQDRWSLFTGHEGLPYDDFTILASGEKGVVWFGTTLGAIRYDGKEWFYRQGPRWLAEDKILCMAVTREGHAWMGTSAGLSLIERRETTLKQTSQFFEDEIDLYHRRTPYGYVDHVRLTRPGDKSQVIQSDSDNDGLWTSMYGAGECYAYAATGDPKARERARVAFEAMNFLREVTQGGTHPAPPGFVARTVLPASGPDPNDGRLERDKRNKEERDHLWKVIDPRWPVSEDGFWCWKSDTSSDELDGHFYFYGLYYDLVVQSEEDRIAVRNHVGAIADHLLDHDFQLVDHDGLPTRWARYSPKEMNAAQEWWVERGLNSQSILSHLATAEHICGGGRYREAMDKLVRDHGYAMNLMYCKAQFGQGSGNQSDDEMAFMNYYNLIKYTEDPTLRSMAAQSLSLYWRLVRATMNPLFHFIYAVCCTHECFRDAWGTHDLTPVDEAWLEDSLDTLKRVLRDRIQWPLKNSHRKDIELLPDCARWESDRPRGHRRCGKVLPIDERHVKHWSHDPWNLDCDGNGTLLADGAIFLLPYYMGRYYGFIEE